MFLDGKVPVTIAPAGRLTLFFSREMILCMGVVGSSSARGSCVIFLGEGVKDAFSGFLARARLLLSWAYKPTLPFHRNICGRNGRCRHDQFAFLPIASLEVYVLRTLPSKVVQGACRPTISDVYTRNYSHLTIAPLPRPKQDRSRVLASAPRKPPASRAARRHARKRTPPP